MQYSSTPDPYVDSATGILRNFFEITSGAELEEAEANITAAGLLRLSEHPPEGNFDLLHLQDIHWHLFHPIYEWAGQIRTVEVEKGHTRFANSDVIEAAASDIFAELHKRNLLKNLSRSDYIASLAHYYSEINVLHPFREGNGRTQRIFFDLLAREADYRLAWERIDADENIAACSLAYNGDESQLALMLSGLLEPLDG